MRRKGVGGTAASYLTAASVFVAILSFERAMYPVLLAAVVFFHELGHVIMAYLMGAEMHSAGGGLYRLCLYYDPSRISYGREALVCAGGVIANFVMAAVAIPFLPGPRAEFFFISNVASAVFNLLPLRVLDGGGILRCRLLARGDADKAERTSRQISLVFTILLFLLSVYVQLSLNGSLSLFALSVYLIADTVLGA